jgi:hypothetical protein
MKLKKRKIITIIYAIFSIICISISIALFCLNPSLNPSIGITNSIIDIQPHYYVPIESTIKIPIRSHANLTEDDFQFHYDFTSEIKI